MRILFTLFFFLALAGGVFGTAAAVLAQTCECAVQGFQKSKLKVPAPFSQDVCTEASQELHKEQGYEDCQWALPEGTTTGQEECLCHIREQVTYSREFSQANGNPERCQDVFLEQDARDSETELGEVVILNCALVAQDEKPFQNDLLTAELQGSINSLNQLRDATLQQVIGRFIKTGLGIIGSIALVMFVYAGMTMLTGSTIVGGGATKQDVLRAKGILTWAVLGLVVVLASYAIVEFIFGTF